MNLSIRLAELTKTRVGRTAGGAPNHLVVRPTDTSERGEDSAEPHARAILDVRGRIMVFMTHNTDISDAWEREDDDPEYFYRFSVTGYAVAINVLLQR